MHLYNILLREQPVPSDTPASVSDEESEDELFPTVQEVLKSPTKSSLRSSASQPAPPPGPGGAGKTEALLPTAWGEQEVSGGEEKISIMEQLMNLDDGLNVKGGMMFSFVANIWERL